MAAPLSIEQMILNHNINVNLTDAHTLSGYTFQDFSMAGHKHGASDISGGGILDPSLLPQATQTQRGAVKVSNVYSGSMDQSNAATPYALSQVTALAETKARAVHQHDPMDIKAGRFTGRMMALSDDTKGFAFLRNIMITTTVPPSQLGNDGDICLVIE